MALPGALLPVLLQRWQLQDAQGGTLFLLAWAGSSVGALLVRGSLRTTLVCGTSAIAVASFALAFCGGHWVDIYICVYGMGLGLTMTTISLIRQRQAEDAGPEMVRLNLLWAIGACACPSLTMRAIHTGNGSPVFLGFSLAFCAAAGWAIFHPQPGLQIASATANRPWTIFRTTPFSLIAMAFLITGTEACAGGWIATYAHRGMHTVAQTIAAPTCFWAGILLSRLVWSVRKPPSGQGYLRVVRGSILLMLCASIVLVASNQTLLVLLASGCLGFGIGPTYPLLLAWALRFQSGGAIFFIAGVGSAVLPWLTGLISSMCSSLRTGLFVPIGASALMLVFSMLLPLSLISRPRDELQLDQATKIEPR